MCLCVKCMCKLFGGELIVGVIYIMCAIRCVVCVRGVRIGCE